MSNDIRDCAMVVADLFSQSADPELLNIELQNELCRREDLPARWWLYESRNSLNRSYGWCLRKDFIPGSIGIDRTRLDLKADNKEQTWRELLREANVCVVQDNFCAVDLDIKDLSVLRAAAKESRELVPSRNPYSWPQKLDDVNFEKLITVETKRGYHFYSGGSIYNLPAELRGQGQLGCRRLKDFPIDLKWGGILVAPGSQVDGFTYRDRHGGILPWRIFDDLLNLPGENLERYPAEDERIFL